MLYPFRTFLDKNEEMINKTSPRGKNHSSVFSYFNQVNLKLEFARQLQV